MATVGLTGWTGAGLFCLPEERVWACEKSERNAAGTGAFYSLRAAGTISKLPWIPSFHLSQFLTQHSNAI